MPRYKLTISSDFLQTVFLLQVERVLHWIFWLKLHSRFTRRTTRLDCLSGSPPVTSIYNPSKCDTGDSLSPQFLVLFREIWVFGCCKIFSACVHVSSSPKSRKFSNVTKSQCKLQNKCSVQSPNFWMLQFTTALLLTSVQWVTEGKRLQLCLVLLAPALDYTKEMEDFLLSICPNHLRRNAEAESATTWEDS